MFGPAVVIPRPAEPKDLDVTAIGLAIGIGLYGLTGVFLTLLALLA